MLIDDKGGEIVYKDSEKITKGVYKDSENITKGDNWEIDINLERYDK